jgi:O-antigen/teichoic acid export membrane protein
MQKKFLSNLFFLILVNLLVKPFWILGIDRSVQNEVGAEIYGSYFALFNLSLILNIFLDLGITNYNNRHISQHSHLLGKYFTRIVALRLVLAVGYSILCLIAGLAFGYDATQMSLLALLSFNQFLLSFILFLRSNVAGLQLFRIDSLLSILDRLLLIVGCSFLLWGRVGAEPFQIEWFVIMQTLALAVTMAVALFVVVYYGRPFSVHWNGRLFRGILKQSIPFALLIFLMGIYGRVDSVMLERLLPDGNLQTGIYAQAFRLLDAVNMIGYLFAVILLPMFSRMLKQKEDIRPLAILGSKLLLLPAFSIALVAWWHGEAIMASLYSAHAEASGKVLSLLLFSFVPMAGTYVFGTLLTANGNLKNLNIIALGGVVLSLIANWVLIPIWGPMGAAAACLSTQMVTFLLQFALAKRLFNISFSKGELVGLLGCIGVVIGTGALTISLSWYIASVVILVLGALCTLLLILPNLHVLRKQS